MHELDTGKIWANSGDSHFLEPEDLWTTILPAKQAARMPRSEKISDDEEIVHVDGESFHRKLPAIMTKRGADGLTIAELSVRPPGARDMRERVKDLDHEGVWGEVMYASLGLWSNMINDQTLVREAAHAQNEWMVSEIKSVAPDRLVPAGQMPLLSVDDAVAEIQHIADIGLHIASLPTGVAPGMPDWNDNAWEPLWAASRTSVWSLIMFDHSPNDAYMTSAHTPSLSRSFTRSRMSRAPGGRTLSSAMVRPSAPRLVMIAGSLRWKLSPSTWTISSSSEIFSLRGMRAACLAGRIVVHRSSGSRKCESPELAQILPLSSSSMSVLRSPRGRSCTRVLGNSVYSCSLTVVKVTIDSGLCTGHGRCYSLSPTVFDSDDDGNGRVIVDDLDPEANAAELAAARIAVANCPEQAISITD